MQIRKPHTVKISLSTLHVPRKVSLIQKMWKQISCSPTCRFLYRTWSHAWEEARKEALGGLAVNAHCSAAHSYTTLCSWLTSPCRRHILPSNGPVKHTCSRPACCVYLHGASWYHPGDIQPESAEAAFIWSLLDLFVAFHSAKITALLFYSVEKCR